MYENIFIRITFKIEIKPKFFLKVSANAFNLGLNFGNFLKYYLTL